MKQDISVIILTYNEEQHIERCIKSLLPFAKEIFLVDSFSTDKTIEIAQNLGVKVYQNPWTNNHAMQFNWGLENCPISTKWIMRMDADEYVLSELSNEIIEKLETLKEDENGIFLKRRVFFLDNWIKRGGYYPIWLLRIWRNGKGICEERWMDEHIKVTEGKSIHFENDIVDHNLNNLSWWTTKHNNYATREAVDLLNNIYNFMNYDEVEAKLFGSQIQRKRWLKLRYAKLPLFVRPFLYFHFRYIFQAGFLDGRAGFIWHFLQGLWYRFLVDAKINEIYHRAGKDKQNILKYIEKQYGIKFDEKSKS
jgi:glycosyltransferase involved in cell wall biosynthesis